MRMKDLEEYLRNPITQELLALIKEQKIACEELINQSVKRTARLADLDLNTLAEYRGQMYALEALLDLREFLDEKIEDRFNIDNNIEDENATEYADERDERHERE